MQAVIHTQYGPPDELELQEVEKPTARTTVGGDIAMEGALVEVKLIAAL